MYSTHSVFSIHAFTLSNLSLAARVPLLTTVCILGFLGSSSKLSRLIHFVSRSFFTAGRARKLRLLVGLSGLEPPTSRLSGVRSNRLSYKPIFRLPGCHPYSLYCVLASSVSSVLQLISVQSEADYAVVEINGIEPLTSCLQSRRSPS